VTNAVEGLLEGQSYTFRYRAFNKYGWGDYSETVTFFAASEPFTISSVVTTIENKFAKVAWDYPDDGGSPILEYLVELKTVAGAYEA
jgi:hypothetical protein